MPELFRCGVTDAAPLANGLRKWALTHLTYFVDAYPTSTGLTKAEADAVIQLAFASWAAVCNLTFSKAASAEAAQIVMTVGRGRRAGVDGPGGILAWCELPNSTNYQGQVEMLWDGDERWDDDPAANGILLLNVTAHELGHGLGLDHVQNPANQLMNPVYARAISSPKDHDISEVVQRYGLPAVAPTPTPPVVPPTSASQPKAMQLLMDDGTLWQFDKPRLVK